MDLVQEYSSSTVTRGWWTSDDIKIWHGVFIPAIVVARGGNFSVAGKTLRRYRKQLLRFSPLAYHLTPVTAWWLCRAIAGGSEPISWLKEFPQELTNPAWTAYDRSVIERWAGSKQVLGLTLAQELQTEPKGEKAALAYALVGFLRHPYAPKKAMRLALRAPEWIREDTLNLTGAMLGGFHGAAVFSPRRLATWKKTQG
jgi:hypothetical protein